MHRPLQATRGAPTKKKQLFARVGRPTRAHHEQMHTILVNEAQDTVGTCADGLGDVEDVSALAYHGSSP